MVSQTNIPHDSSDDIGIATATADNQSHATNDNIREYVVEFLFRPSNDKTNTHVAKTHYTIL